MTEFVVKFKRKGHDILIIIKEIQWWKGGDIGKNFEEFNSRFKRREYHTSMTV